MKRMNAGWLTDIEQKIFDLQISVIKSAKNQSLQRKCRTTIRYRCLLISNKKKEKKH
jgi:hypothetical protein